MNATLDEDAFKCMPIQPAEKSTFPDKFVKKRNDFSNKMGLTILAVVLSMSMIVIGVIYSNEYPIYENIPIWNIVFGFIGLVVVLVRWAFYRYTCLIYFKQHLLFLYLFYNF